ncbi:aldo/keto reductase [Haloarculaceae archaeon H-GB2-1]|nr:aldo/keto reductase [Haloarculaceae archaeon H-GB1-1]MEA5386226.1 aldo/keto reductase [Haloarculaceae archaeon H-GB11]MEA5407727.1 aldo/keto reductase [Haloarculaceae archaeon H-GB2-1]
MPMLGLGTWKNTDPEQCAESVRTAVEMGYRHVDTAQHYHNEAAVGEGLASADVDRDDVFLATKVWTDSLAAEDVRETTQESLERLGVDYLDLLYVHWPADTYDPEETLAAFDDLYADGVIDRVGVSNFTPAHLDTARELLDAPIFANQVEMHPLFQQRALRDVAAEIGIQLVAYSPLSHGQVFDVPELTAVAEKHDVSEAQVSLAWLREKGVTAIPKATGGAHLRDNLDSLALSLDAADVERIDGIDREERFIHPDYAPASW